MSATFRIRGYPTEPVQVGTTVRLEFLTHDYKPVSEMAWQIDWTITGPGSDQHQTREDAGTKIDFVAPLPGGYTVEAKATARNLGASDLVTPPLPASFVRGMPVDSDHEPLANVMFADASGDDDGVTPWHITVQGSGVVAPDGALPVSLQRTGVTGTLDQVLWTIIRNRTNAIGFRRYKRFMDGVMCGGTDPHTGTQLAFTGTQAYRVLKDATDAFLMQECGVADVVPAGFLDPALVEQELADGSPDARRFLEQEPRRYNRNRPVTVDELRALRSLYYEQIRDDHKVVTLPYLNIIQERLADLPLKGPNETPANCYGILQSKLTGPLAMELIWSYWHEEGMLAQTLNVILARFQNRRLTGGHDPLTRLDLAPLRPLANLFWGWAEDEIHRLTVRRRAFEYDHEYGLTLLGRALPDRRTVDSRSRFLESFHTLLHSCYLFFKEDDDTTVLADGFPLLNALRETHLILAEGAHNQFGDLPSAARAEMLIMQWLLARPEMRTFLGGRVMVPYEEDWMDRVDTMKQMQGWGDTSVTHTRDLGVFGEQLLLGIRYGNWSVVNDPQQAANWARYWRPEIQRYTHAYRAATGVDLTERVDATIPAHLLQRRMAVRNRVGA